MEQIEEGDMVCLASFHDGTPKANVYNNTRITTGKGKKKEIRCVSSTNIDREGTIQMIWSDENSVLLCPNIIQYYEVKLTGKSDYTWVSVGLSSTTTMVRNHHIGWDKKTIGIHSDDGRVFNENGKVALECTEAFGAGDIIGCGWNSLNKTVFFTRNGELLQSFDYPHKALNFGIGMKDFEKIEVNNGESEPFEFDLAAFVINVVNGNDLTEFMNHQRAHRKHDCCDCDDCHDGCDCHGDHHH